MNALTKKILTVVSLIAAMAGVAPALAQTGAPPRPLRIVANFPPGGAADLIARAVAVPLSESLGQPVVVENRAGANGNLGGEAVARSAPDGTTLLLSSGGMVSVNPHIYPKMSFDPVRELTPVASAARVLVFLVARADLPVTDIRDFLAYAKARPGKLSFGSAGNGSSPHLAAEMMKSQAELFAVHVPYRGAAPALQDLLAGQIDFYFDPGIGLNQVRA
ncbi:MAG: Bug family tripartite tricarboxylate transporter substrate binding protein, partial [Betaproteobacteria bacterium]